MHQSYEKKLNHPADFRVKYRYYSKEEGGRDKLPFQGIRSDFWYHDSTETWMIWPEFEDENGNILQEDNFPISPSGTARMWIINPERRSFHRQKIHIGTKGFFIEGIRVAECEVIELLGIETNPVK